MEYPNNTVEHPFRRYCLEHDLTQAEFARLVSLSPPYVSQLISGRERIGRIAALRVVEKTGGEVTLAQLLTWEPATPKPAAEGAA